MPTLGSWLAEGPFGLAMSSGFFSFFAHTGMLSALLSRGHVPTSVSGSSAGAMVGGAWAAGIAMEDLAATLNGLSRDDFWDPALGAGVLRGKKFDAVLRRILPVTRIEACRVPLAISVFDILRRQTKVLERGDLSDAIRASCAVPGMFHPVVINERTVSASGAEGLISRRPYWDGGIKDRPGIAGARPGRLLFHHIAAHAPWSKPTSSALEIPRRPEMTTLVLEALPRSNPWRLDQGRLALERARAATLRALDEPIAGDIVRVIV